MHTPETRIIRIIEAHRILLVAYNQILKSLSNPGFYVTKEYEMTTSLEFITNKKISFYDKFEFVFYLIVGSIDYRHFRNIIRLIVYTPMHASKEIKFKTKRKSMKFLVRYFLKTHMHRQFSELYNLYLLELVSQNQGNTNQHDLDELRKITTDLKNYIDTLPSTRKIVISFITIALAFVPAIALLQLNLAPFILLFKNFQIFYIPSILFIVLIIGLIVSKPIILAFTEKRMLLLKSNSDSTYNDFLLGDHQIYDHSIYRLENNLFEILDYITQKPKEIPVDKYMQMFIGEGLFVVIIGLSLVSNYPTIHAESFQQQMISIMLAIAYSSPVALVFFILPNREINERKKHRLI